MIDDATPVVRGDLELLQGSLNLHDHDEDDRTLDPSPETIRTYLVTACLLQEDERFTETDRETFVALQRAIRRLIDSDPSAQVPEQDMWTIDRIGVAAGLHPHFHAAGTPTLEPKAGGVAAALGRLVAIAFVSSFDGSFHQLKTCADETCRAVFYDRSKNHSGRWCSMSECGNRAKVRAWRERQRART